jgi:hypothetical protein
MNPMPRRTKSAEERVMTDPRRSRLLFVRRVVSAVVVAWAVLGLGSDAIYAQGKGKPPPKPEELKQYTLPYFFTVIGVLAVFGSLCLPANRKWDVGREDDDAE